MNGLETADLPLAAAAFEAADLECGAATGEEYGFVAVIAQAAAHFRPLAQAGDLHALAVVHAARILDALFADVHL